MWSPICIDTSKKPKSKIDWFLLDKVRPVVEHGFNIPAPKHRPQVPKVEEENVHGK